MQKIRHIVIILLIYSFTACEKNILEPDPQFLQIRFHYWFRNELNTFEQTYQKDLVQDGTAKTSFWLTSEEQGRILEKVQTINFFQFPDTIRYEPGEDSIAVSISPDPGRQFLRVQYQEQDKTVSWYYPLPENNEYVPLLLELQDLVIEIIESKPDYQALPPARGGYI